MTTTVIRDFSFDNKELKLNWSDDRNSTLDVLWLRDHCQMPISRDPVSGQRLMNVTDIDPDIDINHAGLDSHEENATVIVTFSDGHQSHFSSQWLLENCYCLNQQHEFTRF